MLKSKLTILLSNEAKRNNLLKSTLKSLPKGKLYVRNRNGKLNYSVYLNGREQWITKDKDLVNKHLFKKSIESHLSAAESTCMLLSSLLETFPNYNYNDPLSQRWANEPYERNSYKPEHLKYLTAKGDLVRSKSERFIADALFSLGVPYRYEGLLAFDGHRCYPDFILLKPTGEYIVWEHFGLLNDEDYFNNAVEKIKLYKEYGFTQYKNLICTTEEDLLDRWVVEDILQRFFFS